MTAFPWIDMLRRPDRGRAGLTSDLGAAVSFDGDQFRYLLTQAPAPGGRRVLKRWGVVPREQLSEAQWLDQIRALRLGRVRVTAMLAPHDYQILQVNMPAVPDDELKAAARWRIKDMINVPPDEVTIDVLRLPSPAGAGARQMLVVVARNALVLQTMTRCKAAGFALSAIDIPETGLRNLASAQLGPAGGATATLVAADAECWFSLCADGELLAVRRFPHDGENGVSERIVSEVRRSVDRMERQFPELRIPTLLIDMGTWTQDYLSAIAGETPLACQRFQPAAMFQSEGLDTLDIDGSASFLALAGVGLRDDAPRAETP